MIDDPLRYRILDHEVLKDPDICLVYPSRPHPEDATIPRTESHMLQLRATMSPTKDSQMRDEEQQAIMKRLTAIIALAAIICLTAGAQALAAEG